MVFGKGERVGDAYVEIHANGDKIDDDIKKGFKKADKDVDEAGRRHSKKYGDGFDDEEKRSKRITKSLRDTFTRAKDNPALIKAGKDLNTRLANLIGGDLKDEDSPDWIKAMTEEVHKLGMTSRAAGRDVSGFELKVRETTKTSHGFFSSFRDGFSGVHRSTQELEGFRKKVQVLDDRVDHYADVAGRAFGRGARNDAINLFGAGVRGFALFANIVPKVTKGLFFFKDGFRSVNEAMSGTEGGLSKISAGAGAGTRAFGGLLGSGVALTAGLAALIILLGPMVALISGITAAVVALAGSLSFAAIAGVGALAGALLPLVAGVGVAVAAFATMNDQQKKLLSESVKPLSKEFKALGDVARSALIDDIADSAKGLAPVLDGLKPLVRGVASALGDVARNFVNNLQSPAFAAFKRDMTTFLPNAVRSLGFSFTNTFAGLGGVFRSLIPLTNQFLGWLEKITQNFSDWANSAKGQRQLSAFFRDAAASAKSVGHFLREAVVALSALLDQGRSTGDNIFDDMANALKRFTDFLRANPDAVSRWFGNGLDVARNIGNGIEGIAHAFKALDSGTNRTVLQAIFKGVGFLAKGAGIEIKITTAYMRIFAGVLGAVAFGLGKTLQGIGFLTHADGLKNFGKGLADVGKSMLDFAAHGGKAASSTDSLSSSFGNAESKAAALRDTLDQTTGAATRATRAFLLNELQTSGAAAMANAYGVSNRDLIGAILGNAGAIDRVNAGLAKGGALTFATKAKLGELGLAFDSSGKLIRKSEADLDTWGEALKGIKNKDVRIAIRNTGMEPTIAKFRELIRTQHLTPRQVRIAARALNVDLTKKQLNNLITAAKNLGRQKPSVTPKVDDKPGRKSIDRITKGLHDVDHMNPKPNISADITRALAAAARVVARLGVVDRTHADPRVTAHVNGEGAIQGIINAIGRVHDKVVDVTVRHHDVGTPTKHSTAVGGLFRFAQERQIAEAGPEAVVPLDRPLDQVDPSVRWLSAIAQGLAPPTASGGTFGTGRTVNIAQLQMVSTVPDPRAAAAEFVNKLTAVMYS